jgi:hypothetical protein
VSLTRAVWQVSAGSGRASFADVLLRYGVALVGPGDPGPWTDSRDDDEFGGGFVRCFAAELAPGDVLLLRNGLASIVAVGLVASEYVYYTLFDDVNGRDLQHTRRVRWCRLPEPYEFDGRVFGANPPRFSRVLNEEVVDFAERFVGSPPSHWQEADLPALPKDEPSLEDGPPDVAGPLAEARDLYPLFWDRERFGDHPAEDELVAHFVVPLLRSLGWAPERIALKWRRVDVALFKSLPRTPENCHVVIEAKRPAVGVESALMQARGYLDALGVARDIVLTDGMRYRMYACDRDFTPIAYANLLRLKRPALELFDRLRRP